MIRLITYSKCPPGEFYFVQTEGVYKKFTPTPEILSLAQHVGLFREANQLPRSTLPEALEDIDSFTCARLNNDPRWCYETDVPFSQLTPAALATPQPCATCGAKV